MSRENRAIWQDTHLLAVNLPLTAVRILPDLRTYSAPWISSLNPTCRDSHSGATLIMVGTPTRGCPNRSKISLIEPRGNYACNSVRGSSLSETGTLFTPTVRRESADPGGWDRP